MPTYDPLDATTEIADGPMVITRPLLDLGVPNHVVAEQRYYVIAANYAPPALSSSISVGLETAYFVGDFEHADAEAGGISFVRRWASLPDSRFDYQTFVATYPGIFDQRISFTRTVTSQLEIEYFLCTAGQPYETPDEIPVIDATGYLFLGDSLPRPPDGFLLAADTTPTLSDYLASVTAAAYSIVAEDSGLERYMGDIWSRTVRRVRPQ